MNNFSGISALPSFTFTIEGKEHMFRRVKDSGSQSTYISSKVDKLYNCKVVHSNVKLTINGFNGGKSYCTKMVELPFKSIDICNT